MENICFDSNELALVFNQYIISNYSFVSYVRSKSYVTPSNNFMIYKNVTALELTFRLD